MHCGSSNRVGYVWALYQRDRVGLDLNEAISEGEKAGLRSDGLKGFIRTTPPPPRP
jgi:hypothetical protein